MGGQWVAFGHSEFKVPVRHSSRCAHQSAGCARLELTEEVWPGPKCPALAKIYTPSSAFGIFFQEKQ